MKSMYRTDFHNGARNAICRSRRGIALAELLIAAAILAFSIGAVFATHSLAISIVRHCRIRSVAMDLAMEQLDYARTMKWQSITNNFSPRISTQNSTQFAQQLKVTNKVSFYNGDARIKVVQAEVSWFQTSAAAKSIQKVQMQTFISVDGPSTEGSLN